MLELAYLNSYFKPGLKNLLDVAVLDHAEVHAELAIDQERGRQMKFRSTSRGGACPSC